MPVTEIIQGTEETANVPQTDVENTQGDESLNGEAAAGADADAGSGADAAQAQPETLVVTIGDHEPQAEDENLNFKQLREHAREQAKQLREANRRLAAIEGAGQPQLGTKPTLEGMDYDTAKYEAALESWQQKKLKVEAAQQAQQEALRKQQESWNQKLASHNAAKEAFKARAPDFEEAAAEIEHALSIPQQGILIKAAKDAPLLMYALHKNPAKLKELAAITDPVDYTAELIRTEAQLKVSTGRNEHKPEIMPKGNRVVGAGGDAQLEKLRAEALKTGDLSKVMAYNRSKKKVA